MAVKSNQQIRIKIAQINKAARYVLKKRYLQKVAEYNEETIRKLKEQRDRGFFSDVLGGAGKGSLWGLGIGGIGGGIAGTLVGKQFGNMAGEQVNSMELPEGVTEQERSELASRAQALMPGVIGATGALGGLSLGLPIGATVGGLYRALTHNSRKQKAIDQLKELGIEE